MSFPYEDEVRHEPLDTHKSPGGGPTKEDDDEATSKPTPSTASSSSRMGGSLWRDEKKDAREPTQYSYRSSTSSNNRRKGGNVLAANPHSYHSYQDDDNDDDESNNEYQGVDYGDQREMKTNENDRSMDFDLSVLQSNQYQNSSRSMRQERIGSTRSSSQRNDPNTTTNASNVMVEANYKDSDSPESSSMAQTPPYNQDDQGKVVVVVPTPPTTPWKFLQQHLSTLEQEESVRFCCQSCFWAVLGMAVTVAVILSVWNWADFDDQKVLDLIQGTGPSNNNLFLYGPGSLDGSMQGAAPRDDPLQRVIEVEGASSCRTAMDTPIEFPSLRSGYATILDRTNNAAPPDASSLVCQINAASPALWYAVRGDDARYNVTVSTTRTDSWNQIQVSVVRGTCSDTGTFASGLQCMASVTSSASKVPESDATTATALLASSSESSESESLMAGVEFYGDPDIWYYILVQGVQASDQGDFVLTVQRAWNLPPASAGTEIQGSVVNGTFGMSVAVSADASLVAASAAFADNLNGPRAGQIRFFQKQDASESPMYVETRSGALLGPSFRPSNNEPLTQSLFGFNIALSADGRTLAVLQSNALTIYEAIQQGPTAALAWRGPTLFVETDSVETDSAGSVSLSANGNTVAWNVHVTEESRGYVQVYQRQPFESDNAELMLPSDVWERKGDRLTLGTFATGNVYDKAVALSDNGNALVMAGPDNTARLYDWNEDNELWTLRYNHVIQDATSVAITGNGNCVALGLGGNQNTQVNVFCYRDDESNEDGGTVLQVGQTLTGSSANFGHSVSLSSTGTLLAVGAPWFDGTANRRDSGRVFLYQYYPAPEQQWRLQGRMETLVESDLYGWSTALASDGSALAVGAPWHGRGSGLSQAGLVQVANVYA